MACILVLAAPAAAAPPIAAFGRLSSVDFVAMSPSGAAFAVVIGDERSRQLQIRGTADLTTVRAVPIGSAKVRALAWAGDNHVLVTTSTTALVNGLTGPKREYLAVVDFNLATKRLTHLLDDVVAGVDRKLNTVVRQPVTMILDGRPVAFLEGLSFPGEQGVLTLFRVDLETDRAKHVATGSIDTRGWLVDDAGAIAARVDYAQLSGRWSLWTRRDGRLTSSLVDTRPLDSPVLHGFGRDAGTVMVGIRDDERLTYRQLALGSDRLSEPYTELTDGEPIDDPRTRRVIGAMREESLETVYTFFESADAKLWRMVGKAFPNAVVRLESWSDDRRKIVLRVEGKDFGAAYYLLDVATRHASWLANQYAEIAPGDLADKQAISYPAADGLPIPAYLTLPPERAAKRLPLVVLPHGGPAARDAPGFDWWAQALASRGYAVLQPQFRGSDGFGARFLAAGYGEWGRKMQTDLSDGVGFLARAGTIDPARVCIVGGSYGGYAALAGVALQSDVYRCAVSLAGPSDLRAMLAWEAMLHGGVRNPSLRYWQRFMGAASPSDQRLDTVSPARLAARVTVPVLLIHGVDDTVVPLAQSRTMAQALSRAGKPVKFVTLKGEDHWLSRSDTRAEMLRATTAFLETHLPVGETK